MAKLKINISPKKREEIARAAFWGNNEALAAHIKDVLGYEMDNRKYPANGFTLDDAIKTVAAMDADELVKLMPDSTLAIFQDEEELLTGDATSIRMIFANMTGLNFAGDEYKNYLARVIEMLKFPQLAPERLFITVK